MHRFKFITIIDLDEYPVSYMTHTWKRRINNITQDGRVYCAFKFANVFFTSPPKSQANKPEYKEALKYEIRTLVWFNKSKETLGYGKRSKMIVDSRFGEVILAHHMRRCLSNISQYYIPKDKGLLQHYRLLLTSDRWKPAVQSIYFKQFEGQILQNVEQRYQKINSYLS